MTVLAKLAADPHSALDLGKAAEHLVCADLILEGHRAFLSDQGLPYDVVVDVAGRLVRIQVKATAFPRNLSASDRAPRNGYVWSPRRRGRNGQARLDASHCDLVALVALDIRVVAYLPLAAVPTCVQLMPPGWTSRGEYRRKFLTVDKFPFSEALACV